MASKSVTLEYNDGNGAKLIWYSSKKLTLSGLADQIKDGYSSLLTPKVRSCNHAVTIVANKLFLGAAGKNLTAAQNIDGEHNTHMHCPMMLI